jgi:hypothetical protein
VEETREVEGMKRDHCRVQKEDQDISEQCPQFEEQATDPSAYNIELHVSGTHPLTPFLHLHHIHTSSLLEHSMVLWASR